MPASNTAAHRFAGVDRKTRRTGTPDVFLRRRHFHHARRTSHCGRRFSDKSRRRRWSCSVQVDQAEPEGEELRRNVTQRSDDAGLDCDVHISDPVVHQVCESDCMASERDSAASSAQPVRAPAASGVAGKRKRESTGSFIPVDDEVHVDLVGQQWYININSCGRCGSRAQRGIQRTCGRPKGVHRPGTVHSAGLMEPFELQWRLGSRARSDAAACCTTPR